MMNKVKPIELKTAKMFIAKHHRHANPPLSHRFSIGLFNHEKLRGVLIAGRPVARAYDPLEIIEATRVCTDGIRNGCSQLLGAFARAARAIGYRKAITYTKKSETGSSLKAAGWECVVLGDRKDSWENRKGRKSAEPAGYRWEIKL